MCILCIFVISGHFHDDYARFHEPACNFSAAEFLSVWS
jgi:hypothetical protein